MTNVKTVMIMIEMVGMLLMRMTRTERLLKHTNVILALVSVLVRLMNNVILVLVSVLAMLMNDGRRVTMKTTMMVDFYLPQQREVGFSSTGTRQQININPLFEGTLVCDY